MVRGRPREFDTEEALAKALRVFWERGFQATSITDLTAATGVGRTGLYAAFGDKESLFLLALDRYMALAYTDCAEMLEDEPDARRAVEAHLLRMADSVTKPDDAHSCMLMNTVQESAVLSSKVGERVRQLYLRILGAVQRRLQRAKVEGQLGPDEDTDLLARFLQGQVIVLSVLARNGVQRDVLVAMVKKAMRAWP
jgi:AcrR family transcriptional regulator